MADLAAGAVLAQGVQCDGSCAGRHHAICLAAAADILCTWCHPLQPPLLLLRVSGNEIIGERFAHSDANSLTLVPASCS